MVGLVSKEHIRVVLFGCFCNSLVCHTGTLVLRRVKHEFIVSSQQSPEISNTAQRANGALVLAAIKLTRLIVIDTGNPWINLG
jgi:hypothetical protein